MSDESDPLALLSMSHPYQTQDGTFLIEFPVEPPDYIFDVTPEGHIYARPDGARPIVAPDSGKPYETPDGGL